RGWDWYAHANAQRLVMLLEERGLSGGKILGAGCGPGTRALALASRGCRVTGIALSEAMLAVASRKAPAGSRSWRVAGATHTRPRDGLYERATETVTEWGQPVAGIIERLRKAGFTEVERPWASSPESAAEDDPERHERLTLLVRRS